MTAAVATGWRWRVWFAFEVRPGITLTSTQDLSEHFRALLHSCRTPAGEFDADGFCRWIDYLVDHAHLLGRA